MGLADLDANANLVNVVAVTDVGVEESLEWHSLPQISLSLLDSCDSSSLRRVSR